MLFTGYGGGGSGYSTSMRFQPQTTFNYADEVRPVWMSSVVMPILTWSWNVWDEAPLKMQDFTDPTKPRDIDNHDLLKLLENPNDDYGPAELSNTLIASDVCYGNGYLRAIPGKYAKGTPVQLYAVPWYEMFPRWAADGSEWIGFYEHLVNGTRSYIDKSEIVHFRFGVDPANNRLGISPLFAAVRQIFGHNEASNALASLMRNMGMPGLIISPDISAFGGMPASLSADQRESLKQLAQEKMTGDRRGQPIVPSMPMKIDTVGWSPAQMDFGNILAQTVTIVCAQYNVDPMAFGFASANKTYSNMEEANTAVYHRVAKPAWARRAAALNDQLLRVWYPNDYARNYRLVYDTSNIQALQLDQLIQARTLTLLAGGPIVTPNEARQRMSIDALATDESANELRQKSSGAESAQGGTGEPGQKQDTEKSAARV